MVKHERSRWVIRWIGLCGAVLLGALVFGGPASALAGQSPAVSRLVKLRKAERYFVKTPKSAIEAGGARIHVKSSPENVRRAVLSYGEYPNFIPRFSRARIVGKHGGSTDVYLQVPILNGTAKIWAVIRFLAPVRVGAEERITGSLVRGNVEHLDVVWRIVTLADRTTELSLEMLIAPKLPVSAKAISGEVAYAADKAVAGTRDRAEQTPTDKS